MSFGNIITFMQSLFAAQTIEPEIVGFSGVSLDQASNTLAVIGTIICELIYFLVKWILAVVDFLQYFIQKLIGLDYWLQPGRKSIEGATDNDLLFQFLYNDTVQNVFRAMVGVFIILLVVFVIFSIVKTEWKYATGDGKGGNSKMQIFRSSFKAFILVLVFPLVLTLGIISSNAILASLVGALNLDMAQTFGGTLFSIAAEPANKFRIYSSTDQRAPVTQRITFYVENSTGKTILFSNGTTYPEDKYCTYYSNYAEYLSVIYGKVSGSPRCTEYTIDTIFDVVVPRKERNFSGYCAGLEVDGTTKYFLVKCTYAEKEGMYYYLRNILNAKVLSKNTTINSNQGMTGNTVNELRKDLKDHIESTGKQSFISGADLHDYGSGAVTDAAYNTWGYASIFQQLHTFEESQAFKVIYTDVLSRYELSTSITNAKVSFNSNLISPYFDGGQFGYVSKQAEYKVMADVIDFICNNNADLFMVDVTASTIEWNYGTYTDGIAKYIGGGSDRKTKASVGSGLGGDAVESDDVLPFIVQYSDLCSDADMGNQLYLANYNSSSEIEGAIYIMAWKVIKDGKTRYVPLINGRGYYNEATGQEFPTFKSEFYSNGYRGLVVAKGLLNNETTNQEYGEPTYITSGIDGVSGGVSGVEAPYYYNLTENSKMFQYATEVSSEKTTDVSGAGRYDISNVMVTNVDSTPSVGTSDKGGTYFKLINADGSERETSVGDIEGMTIHLKNRENLSSVTANYAGLEMSFEDSDNDTSKLNNNKKYLFVTGDGGYFVVSACKNASEYFVHEITYSTSTKKATVGTRDTDARINVTKLKTTLKAHYIKGSTEDDIDIASIALNMVEPTTAKVGGKAVYKTIDMQYLSISAINFAKSMYMNLTFDTAKTNLFSYDSDDDNNFMVAQPVAYASANEAILQGTAFFDINYYDYTTGYVEDEDKLYRYDLNSSSTTASAVDSPIMVETFGVNSSEFNWDDDSVSYNLYDGDRYVATIYKPTGTTCTFTEIPTKTSYMMIEYQTFYNVRTMNTYDDKSAFEQESAKMRTSVIISFNRDSLGASSFIFDFRISLLGKGRLKLIMSTYEVERDARKGYFYTSDSMAFDYFFDGEGTVNGNKIELKTFYVPTKVSNPFGVGLWIMLISSALIIKILGTALWGIIKRFYEITLYYIAMPAVASTIVLDDGKRFQTSIQNPLIAKVLSTYGVILGINAFFVLLAPVRSMSNVFTAEDIATSGSYFLKALSNLPLFGSFELTAKLLNSYTYILFLLVAFTMINELPQLITRILGTAKDGGDVVKSGGDTKAQVKKTMNEAGKTLSGQGLMDGASEALGMAKGMIPGSALVSAGAEALGNLFKGKDGDGSKRDDEGDGPQDTGEQQVDGTPTEEPEGIKDPEDAENKDPTQVEAEEDPDASNREDEDPMNPLGEVVDNGVTDVAEEIITDGGGAAVSAIAETVTDAVTGGGGSEVVAAAADAISENIPLNPEEAAEFIAANNEDIVQNEAAIAENNEFIAMAEQAITEEGTKTFESSDRIDQLIASGELDASYVNTHDWGPGKKVKSIADGVVDENGVSLAEKFGIMTSSEVTRSIKSVEQSRSDIEGFQAENATIQAQTDAKRKENEEIEAALAKPVTETTDTTGAGTTRTGTDGTVDDTTGSTGTGKTGTGTGTDGTVVDDTTGSTGTGTIVEDEAVEEETVIDETPDEEADPAANEQARSEAHTKWMQAQSGRRWAQGNLRDRQKELEELQGMFLAEGENETEEQRAQREAHNASIQEKVDAKQKEVDSAKITLNKKMDEEAAAKQRFEELGGYQASGPVQAIVTPGVTETGKKGVEVPAVVDNKQPEGPVDPAVATEAEKAARASLKTHKAELSDRKSERREAQVEFNIAQEGVDNAQASYDAIVEAEAGVTSAQAEYDAAVKEHGADSEEAKAAKEKLDAATQHRDETLETTGSVDEAKQILDDATAERDKKKGALDAAKAREDEAQAAVTKDKQDIENSMTPERKVARRNQITNTVMSILGTAGTVVATIAGGPIAGILVHKASQHLKSAAPGVVNAISQQFGEFKKADGWGKASMIAGMAMKGSAVVAGGILAGQALAFAAPVLGAVGAATGALGVPLWAIGAAGLAGVASNKLNQLTSGNGQSYVNGGKSPVVRVGSGTDVPQVPAGTQTGGKPGTPATTGGKPGTPAAAGGKPAEGPVDPRLATEAEKEARANLKTHKAELSERTQERKEAKVELNIAQEGVDNAQASYDAIVEAEAGVTSAQAEYDAAVKEHGADSEEAKAAKEKLDAATQHRDETLETTGSVDEAKQILDDATAERDKKKTDFEAAETAEKEAKEAVTKDKKAIEDSMTPERKAARRADITNTVMSVVGTAGTVIATIAGGPIAGLLFHRTAKNLKKAAPGIVNAVSEQFGEFKKADGWRRAEIISGMAMKGAALAAGGIAIGSAVGQIATAMPFLGTALGKVGEFTATHLGTPLWMFGAAALSGPATNKLGQLIGGNGSSYVNTGRGEVVRPGTGAAVPQGTVQNAGKPGVAAPQAGGKSGKPGAAQMTQGEAEARERLETARGKHGTAKQERRAAKKEYDAAQKKVNGSEKKLDELIAGTSNDALKSRRAEVVNAQADYDAAVKKHGADSEEAKAAKAHLDDRKAAFDAEVKTCGNDQIKQQKAKLDEEQAERDEKKGAFETAAEEEKKAKGEVTKAKKEVEENMSPERKIERTQRIANTIINGLGTAGTIAATIAGGPIAGLIVHRTAKNIKRASSGVIQSAGAKFGELKAADGWGKAAIISGMVMKGAAITAGTLAVGSAIGQIAEAVPFLGTALTKVSEFSSGTLKTPLWMFGMLGASHLAGSKLGQARDAGTSYVNTGRGTVVRAGSGGEVPAGAVSGRTGAAGARKAVPQMTKAEADAREEFKKKSSEHSEAVTRRKKAQSTLNKLKKKGSGATEDEIKKAQEELDAAKADEGEKKKAKTKAKKAIEENMSPERKAARRENITNTIMSSLGAAGTLAATFAGGPIAGLIFHRTANHLKKAAPGVVNAVSEQFGEFKKADGWRRAEIISGMAMKGAALTAGGLAIGGAVSQIASVMPASVLDGLGKISKFSTEKLKTPLWMFGALGVSRVVSNKFGTARRSGSSYVSNPGTQYVRSGAGAEMPSSTGTVPYSAVDEEALMSARTEYAEGLTVANGPRVVYMPRRVTGLRLSSSAVAARRRARGQADGMNIDTRRSSATIARDRYNLDKINDTTVVADRSAALANVVRNQTNTKVGMQIAARSIARYGGEGDSIGAQIYAGINGTEKQPGLLTPEMKEQLVLAVLSKVQVERYKNMGEADRQKMIDSYKVVGGMKANGEIGFEVTGRDGSRFADRDVTADVLSQMMSSGKISDANINLSTQELGVGAAVEAQLARNLALGVDYSSDLSRTTNLTDSNIYRTVMNSRKYDDVVSEGILRYVTADPNSDLYQTVSRDLGIGDPSELDDSATRERVIEQISRMRRSEGINSINSIQESEYSGQVADVMRERAISGQFNVTAWDYASAATRASEVANIEALKGGVIREDLAAAETRLSRRAVQDNEQMVLLNTFATARVDNKSTIVNDMLNSGKFANITASDDQLLRSIVEGISADDDSETATRVRTAGLDELKLAMKKAIMLRDIGSDRAGLNAEMLAKYLKGGDDIDTALIQEMARRGIGNGSVQSAVGVLQTSLTSGQRTSLLDSAARQGTLGLTVGENRNLRKLVKGTDIDVEKLSYFEASALLHKKSPEDIAKFIELEASRDQAIARLVEAQGGLISNDAVRAELVRGGENGATASLFAGNYSGKMQMLTEVDQEQIKRAAAMAEIDRYNAENPDSVVEYAEHSSLADLAKAVQGNAGLAARIDIAGIDAVDAENRQRLALGMGERIKMYAADIQADPSLYNKARSAFRASNPGKDLDEVDSMTRNNYLANEFIKSLSQNDRNLVKSRRDAIDLDYITKMTGISREEAKALIQEAAQAGLSIDSMMLAKGLIAPVDALSVDTSIMGNIDGREFTELYNEARRENYEEELYGVGRVKYNIMKNSPNATPAVDVDAMNAEQRSRYEFTRNFLQQMSRTGENPNMLANTFRNTTLYDNDRVVEEMAAIHIDGQEDIDPNLSVEEKKKRLSNEQINAYLSAHEEYRDILTSYAAADITRTLDPATKEKSLYDLATRNPELDAKVRAELRSTGKDPASGNQAEYNQALATLMQRDEAFKNAMYSKLTDTFDPGARLSHAERVAFFENSRTIAQGPQGNTMRSISEWLSRYLASDGQDTGNIVLTKKVTLPETSAAYDNWNKYLDSRIAEIKAKKGDYAQMSADERKAEIAKLEAKKIVDNGDTSEEHVKQQEKNKRDAFAVGDFTELYSKGARVDVIHSKQVRAVIAKNGMSTNGEFDVLTGKRITTEVEDRHRLEYAEAQNLRARYKAASAMRTSRDFGENFSAMATSYLGKKEAVAAAREARNAFLAKFQGTASKTGAPVTATTKYEDLTAEQQKYLREMRKAALEQRISARVINASRNVRYDREMRQFDSWTQSQGLVPEVVRYTDGSKRFTQQTSKTSETGTVDPKTAARRRADQLEYLATRDDRQNVTTFNASYRGSAAQYASEIRKQVYGTSAQKAIEELIASRDPISGKRFSEQALSVQKSKIEKVLQDLYSRAESRVNASYKYIPSTARPYIGSSFSLAAGARERELQKSKLADFRSAFTSLSEHRATASFDALYSSLSASIKNSFMNSMNSKERAAFKSQGEAEKFAKLEQYIARNYASLSKHVKVNNFYHTNTSALTELSGVSVQRSVSSAESRAMMRSLRPSESIRYNDILTRHEVAIRNVHAEEANYRRLAEKFATAGPKEREVIRKQMTDSATRLTTYEKTVKLIEEEKRSFEQRIETRRSAGDIIRTAASLGSNKNENVLNNYNMRTKGPHGRPIHPGGPLDRPMNMILLRFMERYKNQLQSMYKTEIYQQSQAVMSYTRGKVNKLSNDIARTIADNRQLRKFLKSEISKLDSSIKATDVALRDAMSNDIARLEEAEREMKVRLSSLEIDLSSMEKKVGKATPTAARPTTKK